MKKQFIAVVTLDDGSRFKVYDNEGKGIFKTEAEAVNAVREHKIYCKGSGAIVGSIGISLESEIKVLSYEIKVREVTPFEVITIM